MKYCINVASELLCLTKLQQLISILYLRNSFLICKHRWRMFVEIDFECSLQAKLCVCDKKKVVFQNNKRCFHCCC
ncbi:hypothetical protein T08_11360 [Trichinella sp. T8]|nr:hypothetical protein T08_11360 [Trichinella sp. T8]